MPCVNFDLFTKEAHRLLSLSHCTGVIRAGYEHTVYNTTETEAMVELCARITNPPGGATDTLTISASTGGGSAGNTQTMTIHVHM